MFQKYYSYDDVLFVPNYTDFSLEEISLETHLVGDIFLKIPIISAAMDTVTELSMALELAKLGGAGVIHRNLPPEIQASQVKQVKSVSVSVDDFPLATLDKSNHLIVGAAVSPQDYLIRMPLLAEAGVDFVVFDVAHGDSKFTLEAIEDCKNKFPIYVIGGNAATKDGSKRLIDVGSDAVKIGVGAGSICTTRIICGIGVPQLSAVLECAEECKKHNIPSIADGGLRYSGDIVKALGAGSNLVMLGNMLAVAEEAAGENVEFQGRIYKRYRGMGSMDAIAQGGAGRYQVEKNKPIVPEGVEGLLPCEGKLEAILYQITTGIKKGMWYCGCKTMSELKDYKQFIEISSAGLQESHAHDLSNIKAAPNYKRY
ncbi:MAG: IMP dehydrogenase [Brevinemataceae bacterium]